MFLLLCALSAVAGPLILEDPSRSSGVGRAVATPEDLDGDGIPEVWAARTDGYTVWTVRDRSSAFMLESDDTVGSEGRVSSLGFYGALGGGAILTYEPGLAVSFAPLVTSSDWKFGVTDVIDGAAGTGARVAFGREGGDDHVLLRESTTSGVRLRAYTTGTTYADPYACMDAGANFGDSVTIVEDVPAYGKVRLAIAEPNTTKTSVGFWDVQALPATFTPPDDLVNQPCTTAKFVNLLDDATVTFLAVGVQYAYGSAPAVDRGGWAAMLATTGVVYVVPYAAGGVEGAITTPFASEYTVASVGELTGTVLLAADVTGDGAPDLVLGDPTAGVVRAWEVRYDGSGAPSFGAEPVRTWTGAAAERFGASVAALPDIDGDGAQELAIGVPGASTGRGHVEIHFSLPEVDTDGDGVLDDADCFPDDPALYPGAELLRDADDDGYGDPGDPAVLVCPWEVDGYVANDRDCDDTDPAVYDGARVYADADGDGHGDADALLTLVCPGENAPWSPDPTDCDDASATVNPDAAEVCNGADDDCDGANDDGVTLLRFTDADGDGVGAGASFETCDPRGTAEVDGDCDDASAAVNPQAEEIVADGIDNDCRGGDATVAWGRGGCGCSAPTAPLGAAHVLVAVGLVWVARRRRRWVQGAPAAARTGRGGA